MPIRSDFLVHWTGNNCKNSDIESYRESERPERYMHRLLNYYEHGLFARRTNEAVVRRMKIKRIVRLCFTEIRPGQATRHSDRYGRLGVGFARQFIISKGGRTVVYIPYDADDSSRLLEDSIKYVYKHSKHDTKTHRAAKYIMAHVKRMGHQGVSDEFFEEMEWRIVFDEGSQNKHFSTCKKDRSDEYRLKFEAADVKLIVFPDEETRSLAIKDVRMRTYFSEHMPILLTLNDCRNF